MLVQHTIEEHLLRDAMQGATISPTLRAQLQQEFHDEKVARAVLAAFRAAMPTGGEYDELVIEELKEICTDLKWAKTKRGKLILNVNEVAPELYKTIRGQWGFADVMIGTHAKRMAVMVVGKVSSQADRERVLALVASAFSHPIVDGMAVHDRA